ncbi:4'-phosphopantetheinyl transferase family protein [Brevibacterium aurantiacum]|uniref:4'-phosphopantetheinyl transferase family protein n=1 Tax=Brevibacterium aurantiacum TaxID=273384 RepID=UPI0011C05EDD|nr:4'-phosphopantetheinyl transferase superfamily protein [Brevibacterium aurantiacum]
MGIEQEVAAGMGPARRTEFCSARALAHDALASLGLTAPQGIGQAGTGAPLWPQGVSGSIAHSGDRIAVAVTDTPGIFIGIDLEPVGAVPADVAVSVTTPGELADAHSRSGLTVNSPLLHTLLYVAKESTFKALNMADAEQIWHPRSLPVQLADWEEHHGTFTINHDLQVQGHWWIDNGYVFASTTIGLES